MNCFIKISQKCSSTFRVALLIIIFSAIAACEISMTLAIDGKYPPTFKLSGSGDLDIFLVAEVAPENQKLVSSQRDSDKDIILWEIWPNQNVDTKIDNLPAITYGVVPPGFTQKIPESGLPPALVEGKVYAAGGPARNANGGSIWFKLHNGKVVEVSKPGGY
jgi:hypothetical protein